MKNKQELEAAAGEFLDRARSTDVREDFKHVYETIMKPVLEFLKKLTGPKTDAKIDKWEHSCEAIIAGQHPDVANYCEVWNKYYIKTMLRGVQVLTGPKVDKAISVFIDISESFCNGVVPAE